MDFWVFINPVQRTGRSGSLYSIADYFGFNPEFVDQQSPLSEAEQFKGALATAHKLGMSVLVDLVINHCAYDSPLVPKEPARVINADTKGIGGRGQN